MSFKNINIHSALDVDMLMYSLSIVTMICCASLSPTAANTVTRVSLISVLRGSNTSHFKCSALRRFKIILLLSC